MTTYKIIRNYFESHRSSQIIARGLTLEEAQEHCRDPETISRTCSAAKARQVGGTWFDGYTEE